MNLRTLLQLRKEKNLTQQVLVDRAKALDPDLRLSDSVLGKYESDHAVAAADRSCSSCRSVRGLAGFLTSGETSRTLPLKDLNETQIQLLLDLTQSFRHKNEHCHSDKQDAKPTTEQAVLIARLIQEILRLIFALTLFFCIRAAFLAILLQ